MSAELVTLDKTRLIAVLARELLMAGGGTPTPAHERLHNRMWAPQVGDLVVEVTSMRGFDPDGIGWLRGIEYDPRYLGDLDLASTWVVEPLDKPGETVRWGNARFFAVPLDRARVWLGPEA